MLDNVIIEEIQRREKERDAELWIPLELPLPFYREPLHEEASPPEDADRGVVIIEM